MRNEAHTIHSRCSCVYRRSNPCVTVSMSGDVALSGSCANSASFSISTCICAQMQPIVPISPRASQMLSSPRAGSGHSGSSRRRCAAWTRKDTSQLTQFTCEHLSYFSLSPQIPSRRDLCLTQAEVKPKAASTRKLASSGR